MRKGFEARFRVVLKRLGARRLDAGVERLLARAQRWSMTEGISFPQALVRLDNSFPCSQCHQLFWKGTHWQKIQAQLELLG